MRLFDLSHSMDRSRNLQDITCICIILLFSGSIYPICANTVTTDLPTDESANSTLEVPGMHLSIKLSNPCTATKPNWWNASNSVNITNENKTVEVKRIKRVLENTANRIKNDSESLLSTNLLTNCSNLHVPDLPGIPTTEQISNGTPKSTLRLFYDSLLNHTAHVYFIAEQSQKYPDQTNCSSQSLQENAGLLAIKMKDLLCHLMTGTIIFKHDDIEPVNFTYPIEQILKEELEDQPSCSKRALRDCQTVSSTTSLAKVIFDYVKTSGHFDVTSTPEVPTESS